ncbi:MAG: hypothetical protein LUG21_05025 [Clostridiales bacterium]|nr:hypothetical protein [Clostridiales bacterium]
MDLFLTKANAQKLQILKENSFAKKEDYSEITEEFNDDWNACINRAIEKCYDSIIINQLKKSEHENNKMGLIDMKCETFSVRNISKMFNKEDEILLYNQFLDNFYSAKTDNEKLLLIEDEPVYNHKHKLILSLIAAAVEKLSKDYNLPIPKWVNKNRYVMEYICYAFETKNSDFQKYLTETSFPEYKKRNLMYGDNVLKRC